MNEDTALQYIDNVSESNLEALSTPQADSVTYIDRLPDDLLYIIFQELFEKEFHHYIWRLLFVSRRWNHFIMECPALWATIEVDFYKDSFQDPLKHSLPYISACLKRSQGLLLDMDLDFGHFPHPDQYDPKVSAISRSELEDMVDPSWKWDRDFESPYYCLIFNKFFHGLLGVDGEYMSRWSTLSINLDVDALFCASIWKRFNGPLPNLRNLSINNFPRPIDFDYNMSFFGQGFRDLSSVNDLSIYDTPPLTLFPLSRTNLRNLYIWFDRTLEDLVPLSAFPELRTLDLYGRKENLWIGPPCDHHLIIHLPHLEQLSLRGDYSPLSRLTLDFPKLDRLIVYTSGAFRKLPKLSLNSIRWVIIYWDKKDLEGALDSLLALSPNLESIKTPDDEIQSMISEEIERRKEKGILRPSPQVLRAGPKNYLHW